MRDVLLVGCSLKDPAVRELALGTGGTVWFANPNPPDADIVAEFTKMKVRVITSPQCEFEAFFTGRPRALPLARRAAPA